MSSSKRNLDQYSTRNLVRDLFPYFAPYKGNIAFTTILRIVGDILLLYPAFALASAVNFLTAHQAGQSLQPLWNIFLLFAAAIAAQSVLHYWAKMKMYAVSEQAGLDLQLASIRHMFSLDISWHEHENTGNKLKKITRGADSADRILRFWVNNILPIAVSLVGTLIVIATFNQTIALATLFFIATYYVIARVMRKQAAQATVAANIQEEKVEGLLFESLNNIRTIKVLGMAGLLLKRLLTESNDLYHKIVRRIFWFQTGAYSGGAYAQLFQIGMLAVIAYGIIQGQYEVGFLVLFSGYFGKLLSSVSELANLAQEYVVAKLSIGRMFEILNQPVSAELKLPLICY